MSGIGRIEELEKTINYFEKHFDDLNIEWENYEQLVVALERNKSKVIFDIVANSLYNKPQIQRQIAETSTHLEYKKKEIQENIQKIQADIDKIEGNKKMTIEPDVRIEFQERKHEQYLKDLKKELEALEQEKEDNQAQTDRIDDIKKNLETPEKLIKTLIGEEARDKRTCLAYESLKRLEHNGLDVGLLLTAEKDGENFICRDDIKLLLEIATNPSLIRELKEIKERKHQINEEHDTSKEESEIKKNKRKIKGRYSIETDISNYMEAILGLYDCASESFNLKQEDEEIELDSIKPVKKAIFKIFAKNKYEELLIKEEEQEKADLSRKNKIEKLNNDIRVYSDLCNYNPEIREKLRAVWECKILKENKSTNAKKVLDNTPREEYSEMPGHEELYTLLNYLNQAEDRDEASAELVDYAQSFISDDIDRFSNEILELKSIMKEKKEDEKYQIEQLKECSSPKAKLALEKGFDPEKIDNLQILNKLESKNSDGVVPAVDLLILYTLTKEENIKNAKAAKKAGYKLDINKIEEEIANGEEIINEVLREYKETADGIEI